MRTQEELKVIFTQISVYIDSKIGWTPYLFNNRIEGDINGITIRIKTYNEETRETAIFDQLYSYEEIERIIDPLIIAKSFVEAYQKALVKG